MEQNEGAELRRRRPDRLELGIIEVFPRDVRPDLHSAQPERPHSVAKLVGGKLGRLHRDRGDGEKAVGMGLDHPGELFVLDAGEGRGELRRLGIKEGLRADRQHLRVDLRCRHVA
jgi:hypothetical protein